MNGPFLRPPAVRFASVALALLFAIVAHASRAAEQAPPIGFSEEWRQALAPLSTMPVQDYGFVRSAYTFGENQLVAITGKKSLKGADPLEAVLRLMADHDAAHETPLLKLSHPDLVAIYGTARISLHQYRDAANHERLIGLITTNQQLWTKPVNELEYRARTLEGLEAKFAIVPRVGEWVAPTKLNGDADESERRIATAWASLKEAILHDDVRAGAVAAAELAGTVEGLANQRGIALPDLQLDLFYHVHAPFKRAAYWFVFAALAYLLAWLINRPGVSWLGWGLLVVGLGEQAVGIYARWILSERAPLSNMFESFAFATAGMVLLAVGFEAVYRTRLVGLGAATLGFIFTVLAHQAPIFDSQINPLVPALQSSWLTYHVVTIMLSYSAFALSFFVGVTYLVKDLAFGGDATTNPLVRRLPSLEAMDVFNYRIIAVGFPLLTAGVILGAVWAATAWGRPWGFDPKETWSAITWLVYAIYLHVRYLAGWQGRRAAILSVVGFIAVLFTYLGVNYLLPGLHSYA